MSTARNTYTKEEPTKRLLIPTKIRIKPSNCNRVEEIKKLSSKSNEQIPIREIYRQRNLKYTNIPIVPKYGIATAVNFLNYQRVINGTGGKSIEKGKGLNFIYNISNNPGKSQEVEGNKLAQGSQLPVKNSKSRHMSNSSLTKTSRKDLNNATINLQNKSIKGEEQTTYLSCSKDIIDLNNSNPHPGQQHNPLTAFINANSKRGTSNNSKLTNIRGNNRTACYFTGKDFFPNLKNAKHIINNNRIKPITAGQSYFQSTTKSPAEQNLDLLRKRGVTYEVGERRKIGSKKTEELASILQGLLSGKAGGRSKRNKRNKRNNEMERKSLTSREEKGSPNTGKYLNQSIVGDSRIAAGKPIVTERRGRGGILEWGGINNKFTSSNHNTSVEESPKRHWISTNSTKPDTGMGTREWTTPTGISSKHSHIIDNFCPLIHNFIPPVVEEMETRNPGAPKNMEGGEVGLTIKTLSTYNTLSPDHNEREEGDLGPRGWKPRLLPTDNISEIARYLKHNANSHSANPSNPPFTLRESSADKGNNINNINNMNNIDNIDNIDDIHKENTNNNNNNRSSKYKKKSLSHNISYARKRIINNNQQPSHPLANIGSKVGRILGDKNIIGANSGQHSQAYNKGVVRGFKRQKINLHARYDPIGRMKIIDGDLSSVLCIPNLTSHNSPLHNANPIYTDKLSGGNMPRRGGGGTPLHANLGLGGSQLVPSPPIYNNKENNTQGDMDMITMHPLEYTYNPPRTKQLNIYLKPINGLSPQELESRGNLSLTPADMLMMDIGDREMNYAVIRDLGGGDTLRLGEGETENSYTGTHQRVTPHNLDPKYPN